MHKAIGKTRLSAPSLFSPWSFDLRGSTLAVNLLGIIPLQRIELADVQYMRLATRDEVSPFYMLFHWPQFMAHRRSARPVYILQTRQGPRLFLILTGGAHFQLRQAIGRSSEPRKRLAA